MQQLDMLTPARAAGLAASQACTDKATRYGDFSPTAAGDYMLDWLRKHGPTRAEELVNACKEAGHRPHSDRAFGSVIRALSQSKRIEVYGFAPRAKGHGTGSGFIWSIRRAAA